MKYLMTWNSSQRRWFKKHDGRQYAVSIRQLKKHFPQAKMQCTKESSATWANRWWKEKEQELQRTEAESPWVHILELLQNQLKYAEQTDQGDLWSRVSLQIEAVKKKIAKDEPCNLAFEEGSLRIETLPTQFLPPQKPLTTRDAICLQIQQAVDTAVPVQPLKPWDLTEIKVTSIEGLLEEFVSFQTQQAKMGAKSLERGDLIRSQAEKFGEYLGVYSPVEVLTAPRLLGFYQYLTGLERSNDWKRDVWSTAKRVVKYAWEQGMISELPRNIDNRELCFRVAVRKVVTFSVDEIHRLIDGSPERAQLYWLLMLNTGMQQKDISELRRDQIDLAAGTITRKRGKTSEFEDVPTVTYRLWDRTLELLKMHIRNEDPVLVNKSGEPLYKVRIRNDGKLTKSDAIKNAFFRVAKQTGVKKPCKAFRKTTATWIENTFDLTTAQLFLGHSAKSVAGRSYVDSSMERLTEALIAAELHFFPKAKRNAES